jgi:nucleoid-associated protein YgaU
MLKSTVIKWAAALLLVPGIPVLAKTLTAKPAAAKPVAAKVTSSAESQKLADAIAFLSKPTHTATAATATKSKTAAHTTLATAGAKTHVVKSGETYSSIAKAVYGSANDWKIIANANPKVAAKSLRPGMVLTIPAFTPPAKSKLTTTTAKPKPVVSTSTLKPSPLVASVLPQ